MTIHRIFWVAAALIALLAAATPGQAAARPEPKREYSPPTRKLPPGGACPRGFRPNGDGDRCVRACRAGFNPLEETRLDPPRSRCVPRRTSRLWYRATLDAAFTGRFQQGPTTVDTTHSWRFTSNGAAILFRQCSGRLSALEDPQETAVAMRIPTDAGRMPCARVGRAIGADLLEDVSFGFRGVVVGGAFRERNELVGSRELTFHVRGPNGESLPDVVTHCEQVFVDEKAGSGPVRWPATVGTLSRAARTGGLGVYGDGQPDVPGPATITRNAVRCPAPPGAVNPLLGGREASSEASGVGELAGRELADLFRPNLAAQYGRRVITATDTVRRTTDLTTGSATFTLTLTRCPDRGRDPAAC